MHRVMHADGASLARLILPVAALLLIGVGRMVSGGGDGGWIVGRTTWYDASPWMTVHRGSCQFGYLGDRFGGKDNWHVAAMNDGNPLYDGPPGPHQRPAGSCGKCFEVRCEPMVFKDGYGVPLDRTKVCKTTEPIVVTITDTCPCTKPENQYSNRRWCCSDMNHFDMGVWAFTQMADPKYGVIGVKYRPISCPGSRDQVMALQGASQYSAGSSPSPKVASPYSAGNFTSPKGASPYSAGSPSPKAASPYTSPSPKAASPFPSPSPKAASPFPFPSPKAASPFTSPSPKAASPYSTGISTSPKGASPFTAGSPVSPKGASPFTAGSPVSPKGASPFTAGSPVSPKGASPFTAGSPVSPKGASPFTAGSSMSPKGASPYITGDFSSHNYSSHG